MTEDVVVPLLESLFDRGRQFSETPRGLESDRQVYALLEDKAGGVVAEFRYIASKIAGGSAFSTSDVGQYIRLPDVEEGGARITPLVYLDGHFSKPQPYFRLQVVLVIHVSADNDVARKIALRFETPEASGKHSYYHSQLCVAIQRGAGTNTLGLPMEATWFPTSHPAWPMDAESPTELLVCLILTLYGKVVGSQIISEAGSRCDRDLFGEALKGMRTQFRDTPVAPTKRRAKKAKKTARK